VVIALIPVVMEFFEIGVIVAFALSLLSVSAILAMREEPKVFYASLLMIVPLTASSIWSLLSSSVTSQIFYYCIHIIFMSFIAVNILSTTYKCKVVNRGVIHGALVVYLMIGLSWGFIYGLVECLHPGSFANVSPILTFGHRPFVYFSFVTLTTLGFGDITPITAVARSLAILEAIIGQLYLIVNVSWLVGLYVAQTREQRSR
jgi:hypothetical protein